MGIVHLAGIGRSPGAVTAALAYLKREKPIPDEDIVEEIILFTSQEIRNGEVKADEYIWNQYGTTHGQKGRRRENVLGVVSEFLREGMLPPWGKMYVWIVDTNDFESCFEAVAKVIIAKGDPEGTGKHLWANLTGGTNVLNAAIIESAIFSGLIARLYYTFISKECERYLQPSAKNRPDLFYFRWIPLYKVKFDDTYYEILRLYQEKGDWCEEKELLSRLKGKGWSLDLHQLKTQYLNRMDGRELERDGSRNRLSELGQQMLKLLDKPLYKALLRREERPPSDLIEQCRQELNEKKWKPP